NLVEQRLKQVVVAAIDDDDLEVLASAPEHLGRIESRETATDDDHALACALGLLVGLHDRLRSIATPTRVPRPERRRTRRNRRTPSRTGAPARGGSGFGHSDGRAESASRSGCRS